MARAGTRRFAATVALSTICLGAGVAGRQETPASERTLLAEDVFKNIQVLRGLPVAAFMGTMGFFSASTGLNCTDCHVQESGGSWERYADDNELKQTTRRMVLMVNGLNRTNFGGRQVVTCVTCHRGVSRPGVMPSIDALYGPPPPDEPGDPFQQAPRQASIDAILDKHVAAIGGAPRVAALTSFVARGTYMAFDDAEKSPMEVFAAAPNKRTAVVHGSLGDTTTTFDGNAAWIAAPAIEKPVPLLPITGQELEGLRVETGLLFPARIKQALANWRIGLPAVLGDRDVQVVQGDTPGGGVVTLCFDDETGLLVRLVRYADSPVGRLVTRVDYEDYREVAGVKLPFRCTVSWLSGRSRFELTEVQPNVRIDPARFAAPR